METNLKGTPTIPSRGRRILVDTWYTAVFPECDSLDTQIQRRFGAGGKRLSRFSMIRGILGWWIARDYDFVVTMNGYPGAYGMIFLTAWLGGSRRCKFILLEFISCPERLLNQLIFAAWFPLVYRPAIRRTLVAAQVMCPAEPEYYARRFGLPACLFHVIPLPLLKEERVQERTYSQSDKMVFASARGLTDWETLFRAAQGANWELFIICSKRDRRRVERLNKDGIATVHSLVPVAEYAQIMTRAAVFALPLQNRPVSCGQLRVRDAISAGTPIVCTRVVGLEGYAIQNRTASVVEVGDHEALRQAINRLLHDIEWRRTLAQRASEVAQDRSDAWFATAIHEFVYRVATDAKASPHPVDPGASSNN